MSTPASVPGIQVGGISTETGELPDELNETNHGQAVREMVHAYNALRKADGGG